jgi:hypothetical protein
MNTVNTIRKNSHGFFGCLEVYGKDGEYLGQIISKKARIDKPTANIDAELLKGILFIDTL